MVAEIDNTAIGTIIHWFEHQVSVFWRASSNSAFWSYYSNRKPPVVLPWESNINILCKGWCLGLGWWISLFGRGSMSPDRQWNIHATDVENATRFYPKIGKTHHMLEQGRHQYLWKGPKTRFLFVPPYCKNSSCKIDVFSWQSSISLFMSKGGYSDTKLSFSTLYPGDAL